MSPKAMLEVVEPLACVLFMGVHPPHGSLPILGILIPFSFIIVSTGIIHPAFSRFDSAFEFSLIHTSITKSYLAMSMPKSVSPLPFVHTNIQCELSFTVSQSILHLSLINGSVSPPISAGAFQLVILKVPFVDNTICPDELSLSVQKSILKVSFILISIFEGHFAESVEGFSIELSLVVDNLELSLPFGVEDLGEFDGEQQIVRHEVTIISKSHGDNNQNQHADSKQPLLWMVPQHSFRLRKNKTCNTIEEDCSIGTSSRVHQTSSSILLNPEATSSPILPPHTAQREMSIGSRSIPMEHQWLLNTSARFNHHKKSPTSKLGPGSYQIARRQKLSVYSFAKNQRFKEKDPGNRKIGPGYYNLPKQHSVGVKLSRSTLKTCMQEIIENQLKTLTPGPGAYPLQQTESQSKDHHSASVQFRSKVDRFKVEVDEHLSPALYYREGDFDRAARKISQKKCNQILNSIGRYHSHSPARRKRVSHSPGPGNYENVYTISKYIRNRCEKGYRGNFGCKQDRFVRNRPHAQVPGPGHYNRSRNRVQLQSLPSPRPSPSFICPNKPPTFQSSQTPFGVYDLSGSSIRYRAEKKRQNIERLRKIDVIIPPFGIGAQRALRFETLT